MKPAPALDLPTVTAQALATVEDAHAAASDLPPPMEGKTDAGPARYEAECNFRAAVLTVMQSVATRLAALEAAIETLPDRVSALEAAAVQTLASIKSLIVLVDALEARIAQLENRVALLEEPVTRTPPN